ncbi:MAG: FAD-dependent monooxygenase [Planctomycetota bacterium]
MSLPTVDTDVLIVGAGPVGLFLAAECARRDLRFRIIERRPAQSVHSKALAIMPRTLEIFDMAGVVEAFLARANRVTEAAVLAAGRPLARMHFDEIESPYPFVAMVPQDLTEKLLVEALRSRGGDVEYETSLVGVEGAENHVAARIERRGAPSEIRARYLVGCDGAHSAVRHALDLPFEGSEYPETFLLADVDTNDFLPAHEMQIFPHERGPLALFPMDATRRRIVAMIEVPEGEAPSLDLVRLLLAERALPEIEARELHWSTYFHIHRRHVRRMRIGRVFLAGDAAHIHSPFGGQGMNTGLQDAWNLAWKLDLAVRGRAHDALLESYARERLPVVEHVLEVTHFMTVALGTPNRIAQALRNAIIPLVSRIAPFQHAFLDNLSELGVACRGSPIVEGAGERYWDESLGGGRGLRRHFLLLHGSDVHPSFARALREAADELHEIVALREVAGRGLTLVRPDGYVAFRTTARADRETLDEVRSLLALHRE